MAISSTTNRVNYTGNGVTTAFSFPYAFQAQADLKVIETVIATGVQTVKALTTDYAISGTTDGQGFYPSGGTVTMLVAPASTVRLTIYRDPAATQTVDLVENDPLPAEVLESAYDKAVMLIQRLKDLAGRSLRQPDGDSADIDVLPSKVTRAGKAMGFDADGDPVASTIDMADLEGLDDAATEAAASAAAAAASAAAAATFDPSSYAALAGATFTGNVRVDANIGTGRTPTQLGDFYKNQNAANLVLIDNPNGGGSATAGVRISTSNGSMDLIANPGGYANLTMPSNASFFFDMIGSTGGDWSIRSTNGYTTRLFVKGSTGQVSFAGAASFGTNGQVLTANGTGSPDWATPAKGLELISTLTASSSAQLDFTAFDSSKYSNYIFMFEKIVPASSDVQFGARISTDAGATYKSGASDYGYQVMASVNAVQVSLQQTSTATAWMTLIAPNNGVGTSTYGLNGTMTFFCPALGDAAMISDLAYWQATGNRVRTAGYASYVAAGTAIDGIRFRFETGNITSGKIYCYGVRK